MHGHRVNEQMDDDYRFTWQVIAPNGTRVGEVAKATRGGYWVTAYKDRTQQNLGYEHTLSDAIAAIVNSKA